MTTLFTPGALLLGAVTTSLKNNLRGGSLQAVPTARTGKTGESFRMMPCSGNLCLVRMSKIPPGLVYKKMSEWRFRLMSQRLQ